MSPLEGLLVVSLEQAVAAPYCTARLADAGARVIKVERAEGDFARRYDTAAKQDSSYFAWLNQGKESVCLDIKTESDKALFRSMLAKADVFVQNLSPGAVERAGFDYETLRKCNTRLVACNISGYGNGESVAGKRGYDLLVQAESGLISVSGSPGEPGRIGVSICDIGTGMTAYYGILEALIERGKSGHGTALDVSLFDVATDWMSVPYIHARYGDGAPEPVGLRHPSIAPYGAFYCADARAVLISIQNEREWERLCGEVLETPELATDPRYDSNNRRVDNRDTLEEQIASRTRSMSSAVFKTKLEQAAIAYASINGVEDISEHPAFRSRRIGTSEGQALCIPATPISWRETRPLDDRRAPRLGEHTDSIRREFRERPVGE